MENTNIQEAKWKCHIIIGIKTELFGFVVTMQEGADEQEVKFRGSCAEEFDELFPQAPPPSRFYVVRCCLIEP